MSVETRTNDEISEWLTIEEMKYYNTYDKDRLMEQSVFAIAFMTYQTPCEIWTIYTKYRQSGIRI